MGVAQFSGVSKADIEALQTRIVDFRNAVRYSQQRIYTVASNTTTTVLDVTGGGFISACFGWATTQNLNINQYFKLTIDGVVTKWSLQFQNCVVGFAPPLPYYNGTGSINFQIQSSQGAMNYWDTDYSGKYAQLLIQPKYFNSGFKLEITNTIASGTTCAVAFEVGVFPS